MKKAFTILELIFVIVAIGIISAIAFPRMGNGKLQKAADQVVSHIRYTQHLAMVDDKYDSNDPNWFVERWTISFGTTVENNGWIYDIASDQNDNNSNSDLVDIARNPLNPNKVLSGWLFFGNAAYSREMDLRNEYGIQNVTFSNSCASGSIQWEMLSFDHLGRPYRGNPHTQTAPLSSTINPQARLILNDCNITLTNSEGSAIIGIEPETGYARIL